MGNTLTTYRHPVSHGLNRAHSVWLNCITELYSKDKWKRLVLTLWPQIAARHMLDPITPAPRRGRPRSNARVQRVLEAATAQFLKHGYERTSMESVAQEAGVSKVTVYSYYPSKDDLFAAVVSTLSDLVAGVSVSDGLDPNKPREALTKLGSQFLLLMRDEQVVAQQRVLFTLAGQQNTACRTFYEQGPQRVITGVASYLRSAHQAQSLHVTDPVTAAEQFLSMLLGAQNFKVLLGIADHAPETERKHIAACVETMLQAFRAHRAS